MPGAYIPNANIAKIPTKDASRIWVKGSRVLEPLTRLEGVDGGWFEVVVGCVGACVVLGVVRMTRGLIGEGHLLCCVLYDC
jgi:hypothetical protein